jgi:AraC-like DNA-binding protein/quercetin dioxygenase-like cupin family protein
MSEEVNSVSDPVTAEHAPALVFAGLVQFEAEQFVRYDGVESRMVLHCLEGSGSVSISGTRHRLVPGDILVTEWRHSASYYPDRERPFMLSGAHLVPQHARDRDVVLDVAIGPDHDLFADPGRRDAPVAGTTDLCRTSGFQRPSLAALLRYVDTAWPPGAPDLSWAFGALLVAELDAHEPRHESALAKLPAELHRLLLDLESDPRVLSLDALATQLDISLATLNRRFRRHLGTTPAAWLQAARMRQARRLFAATDRTVESVARAVGAADGPSLSRQFKRQFGVSPSEWREHCRQSPQDDVNGSSVT